MKIGIITVQLSCINNGDCGKTKFEKWSSE